MQPDPPPNPSSLSAAERQARSRLRQLLGCAPGFIHGSPIELGRKCGKPGCRCASDPSYRHRCLVIGRSLKGKNRSEYIPEEMRREVLAWIANFREASALLESLDRESRKRLRRRKAKAMKTTGRKKAPSSDDC
jgi:hypothetical protein